MITKEEKECFRKTFTQMTYMEIGRIVENALVWKNDVPPGLEIYFSIWCALATINVKRSHRIEDVWELSVGRGLMSERTFGFLIRRDDGTYELRPSSKDTRFITTFNYILEEFSEICPTLKLQGRRRKQRLLSHSSITLVK